MCKSGQFTAKESSLVFDHADLDGNGKLTLEIYSWIFKIGYTLHYSISPYVTMSVCSSVRIF